MRGSRGRYRPKPNTTYRPQFERYEILKRQWVDEHPKATPEDYQRAMRRIAEDCKI